MPSVAVTADAAIKIASVRPSFADTDVFAEMIGFSQADIRRIKGQEQRARGVLVLEEIENEPNNAVNEEGINEEGINEEGVPGGNNEA